MKTHPQTQTLTQNADFMAGLGLLALGSRMRRLSEHFMSDGATLYRDLGLDFAPRWFPLVRLLSDEGAKAVSQAAERLGVSQPAVSQFARELVEAGLISSTADPEDERCRVLALTKAGEECVGKLRPAWRWIEAAVTEMDYEARADLDVRLRGFEEAVARAGLRARVMRIAGHAKEAVEIVDFRPELREHWRTLGAEWISREYVVEAKDEEMLANPEREVLEGGGAIIFARVGEAVVGTVGLLKMSDEQYELIKMGVTPAARGLGVGKRLGERIVEIARERGAKRVVLETNHRARAAIKLYESLGFRHTQPLFAASLSRTDTYMELRVTSDE